MVISTSIIELEKKRPSRSHTCQFLLSRIRSRHEPCFFASTYKNGSMLISTFIWVLKESHPYKTIFPSFCLARNSIQLTLSLNKLVGSLSLLSLISFSASTSLSIIMDGGLSDEPNIASSWAVLIFSSLLFYIVVFKWVTSETMELSSLSKQDFKTQCGT